MNLEFSPENGLICHQKMGPLPSPAKKTYTHQAGVARDHPSSPYSNVEMRTAGASSQYWSTGRECPPLVARAGECGVFSQGTVTPIRNCRGIAVSGDWNASTYYATVIDS